MTSGTDQSSAFDSKVVNGPMRSDYAGTLTESDIGRTVAVCGWVARRREHGEHLAFIDVRDRTGIVQCVVANAHDLRHEYVVRVVGVVRRRPDGTANANVATGEIELAPCDVEVLSTSDALPFQIDDRVEVDETIRLRHRYLDLRSDRMQRNLGLRASVNSALRKAMESQGFTEIETPMLIASTPEGARDFVVPSRLSPGMFYALPQSPQLFKQLCMVGGVDRYYQIARCMRDEDLRSDRQFEFTQLDVEASFVGQVEVLAFISEAVALATEVATGSRPDSVGLGSAMFPQMTWLEAQERFGSDKPDVRFAMELVELTPVFATTEFNAFKAPCVKGIRVPGGAEMTRKRLDEITEQAKLWGAKGLVWMRVEGGVGDTSIPTLQSPVAKFLSEAELAGVASALEVEPGDLVLIVADTRVRTRHVLGLLRLELGRPRVSDGGFHFLWVVDFPLFESIAEDGRPISAHHPFTMPHQDDWHLLESSDPEDLLKIRSQAYDLVLNGWELGSGSVRIHRSDIQSQIFNLLGIGPEEAKGKFGFLLDAFQFGAPPHAGFGFGIDRLVALLAGEENIREVIAFPKTQSGSDPLTLAPSPIESSQLLELGLRILPTI